MNLSQEFQIRKQAELRELRKASGGGKRHEAGGRAPKPLEAKWKLFVGRSPLCEGCGGGRGGEGGSKVWKCGPCVRAVEDAYIRAMERQEVQFSNRQQESLGRGVENIRLVDNVEQGRREIQRLQQLLYEAETAKSAALLDCDLLRKHIESLNEQREDTLRLQDQMLQDNASLHKASQEANEELERAGRMARDVERANEVVRSENQTLQDRIHALLETVGSLRDELRASFKAEGQGREQLSAERREWQATVSTLQQENDDLRRRLAWLERSKAGDVSSSRAATATAKSDTWESLKKEGATAGKGSF